jgi:TolB protein
MRADGSDPARLTTQAAAADVDPAWSADGRRIAFSSDRDGNAEIYVMNADGSAPLRLTTNDAPERRPAWSPQDDRITFERWCTGAGECFPEVVVMSATGAAATRLTMGREPAWSPDGRKIAYVSYDCDHYYYYYDHDYVCQASVIRVIGVDGRGDVGVTHEPASTPAWRW